MLKCKKGLKMKTIWFLTSCSLNLVGETDMKSPIWPRTQYIPNEYWLNKYEGENTKKN